MGETTNISWADHTFNPWWGCTEVSEACLRCYARVFSARVGKPDLWEGKRWRTSPANWREPLRLNRKAEAAGRRARVFCASMADVFDNEVEPAWRADLWEVIRATPHLHWMLLTKRIGNARKMLPPDWPLPNAGLMATLENQEVWNRDWPKLAALPSPWRGVSCEPLLGPIDIGTARPDWIIAGGESGPQRRSIDIAWVRSLRDQCRRNGIAFHFKQWGGLQPKSNGCLLDGVDHKEFPPALAA